MNKVIVAIFCLMSVPALAAKTQLKTTATNKPAATKQQAINTQINTKIVSKSAKTAAINGAMDILGRFAIVREFGKPGAGDVTSATAKKISSTEKLFTITTGVGEQVQLKAFKTAAGWSPAKFGGVAGLPDNS